jgi:Ser/Thr protein kinase RdoA (MazF antagonist)
MTPDEQARRMEIAGYQALTHWGQADATLDLIKYRENAVFKAENSQFKGALRLHRHGYHSDDELRSELQWMQALSHSGIKVPEVVPARSGDLFVKHSGEGLPGELQIDMFQWIDGTQLGTVEDGVSSADDVSQTFGAIGELAARVHNQASGWTLPTGFTRHAWDAEGLAGDNPFWGRFWEIESATPAQAELLSESRDRLLDDLHNVPKIAENYSMIHADFAAENVIIDGGDVRLIDFDDAGFGWHLFELVTALFFIQGEDYFADAQAALFNGYRKHRQLADEDLELLPLFFLARGTTYVGWVHTRSETETAKELTPLILDLVCGLAESYL